MLSIISFVLCLHSKNVFNVDPIILQHVTRRHIYQDFAGVLFQNICQIIQEIISILQLTSSFIRPCTNSDIFHLLFFIFRSVKMYKNYFSSFLLLHFVTSLNFHLIRLPANCVNPGFKFILLISREPVPFNVQNLVGCRSAVSKQCDIQT